MHSFRRGRIRLQRNQGTRWARKVREELMAEDALRRREDYLRLPIDTIPEAVRCRAWRVLPCRRFQCDGSSHVDASTKVWISNWRRRHSENFEDAINRPVRLPMAATDRAHAIQPVVVRVRGLE